MKKLTSLASAALVMALMTAGCGKAPATLPVAAQTATVKYQGDPEVESTTGLHSAFRRVHYAIFDSMDANHDGWLDEYEAGTHMTENDFANADTGKGSSSDKISHTEFIAWCTHVFLWIHTTAGDWTNSFRRDLADVFDRLDTNHDGLISRKELNPTALNRIRLSFEYPRLHISVPVRKVSDDMFKSSDKTGDGNLSQAEFEDMYVEMVVQALAPNTPAPAPSAAPPAPQPAPSAEPPAPPAPPAPAGN